MNPPPLSDNECHRRTLTCGAFAHRVATTIVGLALCGMPAFAEDGTSVNRLAPLDPAPVGEWWRESWREGWTYEHNADFSLTARIRVASKNDVEWWPSGHSGARRSARAVID